MADPQRQLVKEKLVQIGYSITEIAEGKGPSADLAANGHGVGLVVEVKARRDDIERARQFFAGPPGCVIGSHSPIVHDDSLSDLVHYAAKQIASSQRQFSGLGLLWLRATPELGISHADEKMITTLLGRRYVNVLGPDGTIQPGVPCYLAGYADFYRYPMIDLAVLEDPEDRARPLGQSIFAAPCRCPHVAALYLRCGRYTRRHHRPASSRPAGRLRAMG